VASNTFSVENEGTHIENLPRLRGSDHFWATILELTPQAIY